MQWCSAFIIITFVTQNVYNYSYFAPLVEDSVQLLTQALNGAVAFQYDDSNVHLNGTLDGSCDNAVSFGDLVSTMMLAASFDGKSVMHIIYEM